MLSEMTQEQHWGYFALFSVIIQCIAGSMLIVMLLYDLCEERTYDCVYYNSIQCAVTQCVTSVTLFGSSSLEMAPIYCISS